jgi:hypothetical protein
VPGSPGNNAQTLYTNTTYGLKFAHALQPIGSGEIVLHVEVVEQWKARVRPCPIDECAQFEYERRQHKPAPACLLVYSVMKAVAGVQLTLGTTTC